MPVTDEFVAAAGRDPRRPALTIGEAVDLDRAALDYGTLIARARAVAHALPALLDGRLEAGRTRIALLATDNAPFVPIFLGILLAGATAVILDPKWTAGERHRALKAARADLLVADAAIADAGVATVAAADPELDLARPGAPAAPVPGDDAPFLITFTAGTTAAPKGLIRSHRSWRASLAAARQAFPIVCGDAVLIPGPLAHSVSLFALVEALSAGAHVHLLSRFDAATVLATLARHPISRLTAVPTMYAAIAAKAEAGAHGRRFAGVTALVSAGSSWNRGFVSAWRGFSPRPHRRVLWRIGTELRRLRLCG